MLVQNAWNFKMLYRLYIHFWLNVKSDNVLKSICFPLQLILFGTNTSHHSRRQSMMIKKEALKGL